MERELGRLLHIISLLLMPRFPVLAPPAGFIAALAMASIWGTKATELKTLLDEEVEKLATTETTEHDQYKAYCEYHTRHLEKSPVNTND